MFTSSPSFHHFVSSYPLAFKQQFLTFTEAGLFESLLGWTSGTALKLYQITYLFGFALSTVLFISINYFFPPIGLGREEPFDETLIEAVDTSGVVVAAEESDSATKRATADEKHVDATIV